MIFNILFAFLLVTLTNGLLVTISNKDPRRDVNGDIIDCHSGMILAVNGVYYMYGEVYHNNTGFGPSPPVMFPKIAVYTSPDMVSWTPRGEAISDWPTKPYGTFFTPFAIYNKPTQTFVLYFNAYLNGCCEGNWGIATSTDGIHFTLQTTNAVGKYSVVDCNALMVDDDGTAYLAYTSEAEDHKVSIEQLSSNFSSIVPGENKGLFPDRYIEGAILFKRGTTYYVSYGSCCCFCRGGSGAVVYKSQSINGPWVRQALDVNCNRTDAGSICGAYGDRNNDPIIIQAQGIGVSIIPLADGTTAILWHGERWLSAANNNPTCPDECQPQVAPKCAEEPGYIKGEGYSYWIPLEFDNDGNVQKFAPFVDSFTLDVAVNFGVDHLN